MIRSVRVRRLPARQGARHFYAPQRRQIRLSDEVELPHAAVFEVVADVTNYHQFVPFCSKSDIVARHGPDRFDARLSLGFLAFTEEYTSHVHLTPPISIVAEASDAPLFQHLRTEWRFDEGPNGESCKLHFHLDLQLHSMVHDQALRTVIDRVASEQVAAFKRRCGQLAPELRQRHSPSARPNVDGIRGTNASGSGSAVEEGGGRPVAASHAATGASGAASPDLHPQMDPAWRQRVDAAFDAFAMNGVTLTLPRFAEACRALGVGADPPSLPPLTAAIARTGTVSELDHGHHHAHKPAARELQQALLASWFVEFDEDASGSVDRDEFVRNLWMFTHASEEERMRFVFRKLDLNGSGYLEPEDLERSMRRQLGLARRLVPLLVRRRLRREGFEVLMAAGTAGEAPSRGKSSSSSRGSRGSVGNSSDARERRERLREQASAVAAAAIDDLEAQVEPLVGDVFAGFGGEERIGFDRWREAWSRSDVDRRSGIDGILGALVKQGKRSRHG